MLVVTVEPCWLQEPVEPVEQGYCLMHTYIRNQECKGDASLQGLGFDSVFLGTVLCNEKVTAATGIEWVAPQLEPM